MSSSSFVSIAAPAPGDTTVRSGRLPFMPTPRSTTASPMTPPRSASPTRFARLIDGGDDAILGPHVAAASPHSPHSPHSPRSPFASAEPARSAGGRMRSPSPPPPSPARLVVPSSVSRPRSHLGVCEGPDTSLASVLPMGRRPASPMRPASPSKYYLSARPSSPTRPSSPSRRSLAQHAIPLPGSMVRPSSPDRERRREMPPSVVLPPSSVTATRRTGPRELSPLTASVKANVTAVDMSPPVIRAKVTQGLFCSQPKKPQPWPSRSAGTASPAMNHNTSPARASARMRPPALAPGLFDVAPADWSSCSAAEESKEENVVVHVRVRPSQEASMWVPDLGMAQISADPALSKAPSGAGAGTTYSFDGVHTGSDNAPVYLSTGRPLVQAVLAGFDAVLFAYGQTASGKTFTLLGDDAGTSPGIIPRAIQDVFAGIAQADQEEREFLLRVSYLEIYNEQVKDLLDPANKPQLRDDPRRPAGRGKSGGVVVKPLCEEIVTSPAAVASLLERGQVNRHIGSTDWNERSSRSHTCFKLTVESWLRSDASTVRVSELSLIDLAGSERYVSQGAARRAEGAFINKSLLTLGKVIYHLSEAATAPPGSAPVGHIPYRDSKLTRLLQNSLSGQARVAVICTLNPAPTAAEESISTLNFAKRCKKVSVRAERREVWAAGGGTVPAELQALLVRYKTEAEQLRAQLASATQMGQDQWGEIQTRLDLLERIKVRGGRDEQRAPMAARPVSPVKGARGGDYQAGDGSGGDDSAETVDLHSSAPVLREKLFAAESEVARLRAELRGRPAAGQDAQETISELRKRCAELEVVLDGMGGAAALDKPAGPRAAVPGTATSTYEARIAALEQEVALKDAYAMRLAAECAELRQDKETLWFVAHGKTSALVHGCAPAGRPQSAGRPRRSRSMGGQQELLGASLDAVADEMRSTLGARIVSDA